MTSVDSFLPTLERARAAGLTTAPGAYLPGLDLLAGDPTEEVPLAVVIVEARVLTRAAEERQLQLPEKMVDALATAAPALPQSWDKMERHSYLVERHGHVTDCEQCELVRGKIPCVACGGTGWMYGGGGDNDAKTPCSGCDKSGVITCPSCDGAGDALWVRVMNLLDETATLRYAYVPSMVDELDLALGELFDPLPEVLPESLRFESMPKAKSSAYRGKVGEAEDGFHGHRFGDALARALTAVKGLSGSATVAKREIKTYAWPILWLQYRGLLRRGDVAIVMAPATGQPQAVVA